MLPAKEVNIPSHCSACSVLVTQNSVYDYQSLDWSSLQVRNSELVSVKLWSPSETLHISPFVFAHAFLSSSSATVCYTITLLFHFAVILYKKHEEQEYASNDRDSKNDLRCHRDRDVPCTEMQYWRTAKASLQHRKISSSKLNHLRICGFMSFKVLGLNKETDTAKLSPLKSHKYLIIIFSVIFTQRDCPR